MKKSKSRIIASALAIVITILAVAGISQASPLSRGQNRPNVNDLAPEKLDQFIANHPDWQVKRQKIEQNQQAIIEALNNADYNTWLEAVGADSQQAQVITQDNFPKLIEAHKLMEEGRAKLEQAQQIRQDLGLQSPMQKGRIFHKGFGSQTPIEK